MLKEIKRGGSIGSDGEVVQSHGATEAISGSWSYVVNTEHSRPECEPFSREMMETAEAMVKAAKIKPGEKLLIWFDDPGLEFVRCLRRVCLAIPGIEIGYYRRTYEDDADRLIALAKNEDKPNTAEAIKAGVETIYESERQAVDWATNMLMVRNPDFPEAMDKVPEEVKKVYQEVRESIHHCRTIHTKPWVLTLWPTPDEAKREGLDYPIYFGKFLEACNQPWEKIEAAQQTLVEILNKGEVLELYANQEDPDPRKQTRVTMSIKGMGFLNSITENNFPGSEVYSAPVLDSVNGQIFAPGIYIYDGTVMKDIYLKIIDGVIVEAYADVGNDGLQTILNNGSGGKSFGEVAFGTNPGITQRFINPLLNEKTIGSFHLAIGHCYHDEEYEGNMVHVDNGNSSENAPNHWDITILMHPGTGGGKVVVDGKTISENGRWLDPRLKILNPRGI